MPLIAVRGRDAGRVRAEASQGLARIEEERPRAHPLADRPGGGEREPQGAYEADAHDPGVGAEAAGFELGLKIDHPIEVGIAQPGSVLPERFPEATAPVEDRAEDVERQELRPRDHVMWVELRSWVATISSRITLVIRRVRSRFFGVTWFESSQTIFFGLRAFR